VSLVDLFTLKAPLLIRFPDHTQHVMVACFQHPSGIVYFRPFWDQLRDGEGIPVYEFRAHGNINNKEGRVSLIPVI